MEQKSYDIEVLLRRYVFHGTRQWLASGKTLKTLAAKAGVATTTVSKLAYGETKYPRFHTVVAICDALGYKLEVRIDAPLEAVNVIRFPQIGEGK
jgi:DNA-binding Xre family transcriptional regulator